tara:strand:+ start:41953 stop:42492 length:540 start_codon:yes stop_codon:yes gene_type:complete
MMIKKVFLLLFLCLSISVSSQEWNQNDDQTKTTFTIKNFGVNVDGYFSNIKINTNFNSKNLSESNINAEIVVKSISTGIESRDEHILDEDYFDESNHKTIVLKSTKFHKSDNGNFEMIAELTIKGITKQLQIPLEILESENDILIKANFTINRKDFKVGGGSFIMSKNVKIQVEYRGTK